MSSLHFNQSNILIILTIISFFKHFINTIGKSKLQKIGWLLYLKFGPVLGLNKSLDVLLQKLKELKTVNKEKKMISPQDEYSKWTKLNRKSEKLVLEIKKLEQVLGGSKNHAKNLMSFLIIFFLTVPHWYFKIFYRSMVLFYLPKNTLPYFIQFIFALPFTKIGAISLGIWITALDNVIYSLFYIISIFFIKPESILEKKAGVTKIKSQENI